MNLTKRFIALLLAGVLVFATGCTNSDVKDKQDDVVTTTEATTTAPIETEEATSTTPETTTEATTTTPEVTTEETTTTIQTTTVATTTTVETEPEPEWIITPADEKLYATADLNVRATPQADGERISHVDKGDLVEVTGWVDNGWARIKFRDSEYFVNGKYLSSEKPKEETTAATTVATTVATTTNAATIATAKKEYDFDYTKSKYNLKEIMTADSLYELCEDYFMLGVGLTGNGRSTGAVNSAEYMAITYKHFNSVTLTNLMKPSYLLNQSASIKNASSGKNTTPAVSFDAVDDTLKWCYENGVQMRGHTLVWHTQTPDWFFREGFKSDGAYVDYDTMAARLDSYIKQVMTYCQNKYPGVIYAWDVVNEAVDPDSADPKSYFGVRTKHEGTKDNPWYVTLGEDYVELAFTSARKYADDDVKLFYNDYNTFQSVKRDNIYKLCKKLADKGLIDGIGMQGYWGINWPNLSDVETAINKFATLGLEIHITELSVSVDDLSAQNLKTQATKYEQIFKMLLRCDTAGGGKANITSVTLFGLQDGFVMYSSDTTTSRILDKNFEPKPCFDSIYKVLKSAK